MSPLVTAGSVTSKGSLVPLGSFTSDGTAGSWGFSNIPQTYQDLMMVFSVGIVGNIGYMYPYYNAFGSGAYSVTTLYTDGSSVVSARATGQGVVGTTTASILNNDVTVSGVIHILNYTNTNTLKTALMRIAQNQHGTGYTSISANLWNQTAAITAINGGTFSAGSAYSAGSKITLYGVRAAGQ